MSHIIGRPDEGVLDILLGDDGADPERAIIAGQDEDDDQPGDEPALPEA